MSTVPLDEFRVVLLDMNSTFMFGEDRFGPTEDFGATYRSLGGRALPSHEVREIIDAAFAFLEARYSDPLYQDDFPSLAEALSTVAPGQPLGELALLEATFSQHELGLVPEEYVAGLKALGATHERRLLTNIWAPKGPWLTELARSGVLSLFRLTVFSSDTRSVKPSRRLLEAALAGLPCEAHQVLMVGDNWERDLRPAHALGLRTVLVTPLPTVSSAAAPCIDYHLPSLLALVDPANDRRPAA